MSRGGARAQVGATDLAPRIGRELLLAVVGPPLAWTVHLLGAYVMVALWCAEQWPGLTLAVLALTAACFVASAASGILAYRLWHRGRQALSTDREPGAPESWDARMGERGARFVFLAVLAMFMAVLFSYLIVLEGLPPLFAPHCEPGTVP